MKTTAWISLTGILSIVFLIAPQFQSKAEETENEILTISTDSLTLSTQPDSICLTDEKLEYAALSDITAIQIPDSISLIKSTYEKKVKLDIYDFPYSLTRNMPNWKRLWINTGTLFAGGFFAVKSKIPS